MNINAKIKPAIAGDKLLRQTTDNLYGGNAIADTCLSGRKKEI
ncbi:hypothetical protein [Spirulina sp. 06S082]|nr:hypothetical protein [Spirulina sp. 06S082]MEA5469672.1 hypothetical protein [Spirulina sp. 06S082]